MSTAARQQRTTGRADSPKRPRLRLILGGGRSSPFYPDGWRRFVRMLGRDGAELEWRGNRAILVAAPGVIAPHEWRWIEDRDSDIQAGIRRYRFKVVLGGKGISP